MPGSTARAAVSVGLVAAGGAAGTGVRYAVESALPHTGTGWPTGTSIVNVVGSFVLGVLLEGLARRGPDTGSRRRLRLLFGVGFCGALTTYSTFALEIVESMQQGAAPLAAAYAAASIAAGLVAAGAGLATAGAVRRAPS
ncbi:CrcB family protein [Rhodococcus kroppenstedtii]|uniref:fluoride efflux transporter FluC n=1 Tax=Rhodococcoides kroppenstedtii TaxID=293050 RepID=UPI001C9A409F|nr:CrcB family protein [Rhodococcus kroppenstedtii]MBY6437285.1 CrcB family protein [Rhodococcus kroppenstedtii]